MNFLIEHYPHFFQIIAAILALLVYCKCEKTKFLLVLTVFLCLTVIVESIGVTLSVLKRKNWYVYYAYLFFEFNLIALMYLSIIKSSGSRKLIKVLVVLLSIFYLLTYGFTSMQYSLLSLRSFIIGVFLFLYLNELLQSNKVVNYIKELPFWVTVGFFIFYLGSIPFFSMLKGMKDRSLFYILYILVMLMNVSISVGLIIKLLENKKVNKNNIEIDNC